MKSSQDVWFISFLKIKGHQMTKYEVIGRGKVKCYFDISDDDWKDLKLEFNKSEISLYKSTIEAIKDLAFILVGFIIFI
jgi:hypothetical protein